MVCKDTWNTWFLICDDHHKMRRWWQENQYFKPLVEVSRSLRNSVLLPTMMHESVYCSVWYDLKKKFTNVIYPRFFTGLLKRSMKLCNLSSLANFKYKDERLRVKYEKTLKNKVSWFPIDKLSILIYHHHHHQGRKWYSCPQDAVWILSCIHYVT